MAENTDLLWVNTGLRLKETNRCQIVVGQSFIGDCLPVPCRLPSTSFVEHECSYAASRELIREKERRSHRVSGPLPCRKTIPGCTSALLGRNSVPERTTSPT